TLVALCDGERIGLADLPAELRKPARVAHATVEQPLHAAERSTLLSTLEQQHWHMSRTAEQLGISRNTLYRKMHKHGIKRP
ncbi:MAG: helix-turn-helix domain-containing protein, partial [Pseudomonas sp.]